MKDTKLQMLTTRFEELKMSEDKSFDSFYGKLNEVVIGKFNLGDVDTPFCNLHLTSHWG